MALEVCTIGDEVKELLKKFRFRKEKHNAAIILKVDPQSQTVIVDEELTHVVDVEELKESIPDTQPRYVLVSWKMVHDDGRISFPMAFLFTTPRDCQPRLQMLYSGSYNHLIQECGLTKVFQLRDLEELDDDWLKTHLGK